jgi:hypothetical protein
LNPGFEASKVSPGRVRVHQCVDYRIGLGTG